MSTQATMFQTQIAALVEENASLRTEANDFRAKVATLVEENASLKKEALEIGQKRGEPKSYVTCD